MRKVLILTSLLLLSASLIGQTGNPFLDPTDATNPEPIVSFTQTWDDGLPPFFTVTISNSGQAAYESTPEPKRAGVPYAVQFTASSDARKKVFDIAHQLNYFDGDWDFKKSRIAYTGTKTLRWQNGKQQHETSYNWSSNVSIQQLSALFQNISETVELGRKLEEKYRYDKLGVDAQLKALEQAAKDDRLAELQIIQPLLTKIAKDTSLMNISRRRAEFLLLKVPKDVQLSVEK